MAHHARALPLHPRNPLARCAAGITPYVYYHTHVVTQANLDEALDAEASIEFDVYADDRCGPAHIQHPPAFYSHRGLPPPANLPLAHAVAAVEAGPPSTVLVLDVKSAAACHHVHEIVGRLGAHRVIVHAFAEELDFSTEEERAAAEPHNSDENNRLASVVDAASPEGAVHRAAVVLTCRSLTPGRLADGALGALDAIGRVTQGGGVDAVGLWLPGGVAPERRHARRLLDEFGLLVVYNVDTDDASGADAWEAYEQREVAAARAAAGGCALPRGSRLEGLPYVGMTDVLGRSTTHTDNQ